MADLSFEKEITGLLLIDPYSDSYPRAADCGIASRALPNKRLHPSDVAAADNCAKGGTARFLCDASSLPPGRLHNLEVRGACSQSSMVAKEI